MSNFEAVLVLMALLGVLTLFAAIVSAIAQYRETRRLRRRQRLDDTWDETKSRGRVKDRES